MESTPRVILEIKSMYMSFNKTEKKIADYILNDPQKVIYSTISQVAAELDVADSTIFRFCKKINFKGFYDLKISLAADSTADTHNYSAAQITDSDSEQAIINKVFNSNISVLNDTMNMIDPMCIKKAVDYILDSDQIVFYGNGGSGIVAMDANHKFLRIGLKVSSYTDYHMQLMSVSQLTEKDAIVVISHSGSNLDILNLLDIAKENGTKTIGITSFSKSPVSQKVDVPINVISHETEQQFEAFASRIAHLAVIDVLYNCTAIRRKELSTVAVKKMREAISYTRI